MQYSSERTAGEVDVFCDAEQVEDQQVLFQHGNAFFPDDALLLVVERGEQ